MAKNTQFVHTIFPQSHSLVLIQLVPQWGTTTFFLDDTSRGRFPAGLTHISPPPPLPGVHRPQKENWPGDHLFGTQLRPPGWHTFRALAPLLWKGRPFLEPLAITGLVSLICGGYGFLWTREARREGGGAGLLRGCPPRSAICCIDAPGGYTLHWGTANFRREKYGWTKFGVVTIWLFC